MSRLRFSEYVPPMAAADARRLRGLPGTWEQAVPESAVEGLSRRAEALATALARRGRRRDAIELRRVAALLRGADELHRHASDLETLVGLCRALEALSCDRQGPGVEGSVAWTQVGAAEPHAGRGPAFRETAALRNRAFRWLASLLARYERGLACASAAARTR